jgi:hypothetical protein
MGVLQYNYELKKSLMPGFMVKGIKIDDAWVSRCKRYMGDEGCDLHRLVSFIRNGLTDRRSENFSDKALDEKLTVAQQWLVLHLCLKDGIPEWVRDEANDENAPELIVPEPVQQGLAGAALNAAMRPVQSLTGKKAEESSEEQQDQE